MTMDWRGKRVVVIGLGIEGEDLVRYFVRHGARVAVSTVDAIARRVEAMNDLGVRIYLGANQASDVDGADMVCVSQGVPLDNPAVAAARIGGIPIESASPAPAVRRPRRRWSTPSLRRRDATTCSAATSAAGCWRSSIRPFLRAQPWSRSATLNCS